MSTLSPPFAKHFFGDENIPPQQPTQRQTKWKELNRLVKETFPQTKNPTDLQLEKISTTISNSKIPLVELDLSKKQFKQILPFLTYLDLRKFDPFHKFTLPKNKEIIKPAAIEEKILKNATNLKVLIAGEVIQYIPGNLSKVEKLDLSKNYFITTIPSSVAKSLIDLNASYSALKKIPKAATSLSILTVKETCSIKTIPLEAAGNLTELNALNSALLIPSQKSSPKLRRITAGGEPPQPVIF